MKALIIIYDQELDGEVFSILKANHITNYTKLTDIQGAGGSGLKFGDAVGPGLNYVCIIIEGDERIEILFNEFFDFKQHKLKKRGVQILTFPIERMI